MRRGGAAVHTEPLLEIMRAFVTGSTGLLGSNLVKTLLEQGHEVRGLVRSPEKAQRIFADGKIDLVTGNVQDVATFAHSLAGCDALFHTAAYFREYYQPGNHKAMLERINVQGTIDLLIAAEKHGVKKAVHISASGVIGRKPDGSPGDETTPPDEYASSISISRARSRASWRSAVFSKNDRCRWLWSFRRGCGARATGRRPRPASWCSIS
jgi:nucleoside-diphosphate-sugar epimerase